MSASGRGELYPGNALVPQRVVTRSTFLVGQRAGQVPHAHKLLGADHEAEADLVELAKRFVSRISCFRCFREDAVMGRCFAVLFSKPAPSKPAL